MKIEQSIVQLQSRSEQVRQYTATESLRTWNNVPEAPVRNQPKAIQVDLSDAAKARSKACSACGSAGMSDKDNSMADMFEQIIYLLTGKRVKFHVPALSINMDQANQIQAVELQRGEGPRRLGWGVEYQAQEQTYE